MQSGIEIRAMKVRDVPWVAPLMAELGYPVRPAELEQRYCGLDPAAAVSFVAERAGTIVGWIHLVRRDTLLNSSRMEIIALVVKEDARGAGVGKALVNAGLDWSRAHGFATVRVTSNLKREESHPFYRRIGFQLTKESAVYDLSV